MRDLNGGAPRPHEVLLLGATGFCGRFIAAELDRAGLRWWGAARDPSRAPFPVARLDLQDHRGLCALVGQARVVLSALGPATDVGEPVLAACVDARTDYVDITGETPWITRMIPRFDDAARAARVRLVPGCGFESVPADLGSLALVQQHRARGVATRRVVALVSARAGLNGGTLRSVEAMATRGWYDEARGDRGGSWVSWHPEHGAWSARHPTGGVDTATVMRSAALSRSPAEVGAAYGGDFQFQARWRAGGPLQAAAKSGVVELLHAALGSGWVRGGLGRVGPKPGEGPSEWGVARGRFRIDLAAEAEDGMVNHGYLAGEGDPGTVQTARLVVAAAGALARDPVPQHFGLLTPAYAIGGALLRRLPPGIEQGGLSPADV